MGYRLDVWGLIHGRSKLFVFSILPRLALWPTQPPMHHILEALSLGLKQQWLEAYHSCPSSVEVKNGGATPSLPPMSSCHAASVTKHRNNFAFMKLSDPYSWTIFKIIINICQNISFFTFKIWHGRQWKGECYKLLWTSSDCLPYRSIINPGLHRSWP
jgi:hypothetical protein